MKLIVGLGNPGEKYAQTRHNAGFMVMDALAKKAGVEINKKKFQGVYAKTKIKGEDVIFLKPETYMNNSGFSVRACMDFFKIDPKDLLVIYDDLDTPVGSIRLKPSGSAGGHNGMKSVIQAAMGQNFDRIRVGIGRDPKIRIIDYVLTRFKPDEIEDLNHAIEQAAKAAWFSIDHDFSQTMTRFNTKPKKKKADPLKESLKEKKIESYTPGKQDQIFQPVKTSEQEEEKKTDDAPVFEASDFSRSSSAQSEDSVQIEMKSDEME